MSIVDFEPKPPLSISHTLKAVSQNSHSTILHATHSLRWATAYLSEHQGADDETPTQNDIDKVQGSKVGADKITKEVDQIFIQKTEQKKKGYFNQKNPKKRAYK